MATRDQFKDWVKEFVELDTEIKASNKALNGLKKQKVQLASSILDWMQSNNIARVNTAGGILQRELSTRSESISAVYVQTKLLEYMAEEEASEITKKLWSERNLNESERLSLKKGGGGGATAS